MSIRLSAALWSATTLLVLALLIRNIAAIEILAPLDPNEGWNAAHTLFLLAKGTPYPPPQGLMINNYPPLSFYLVGALTRWTGDAVIAGRILSLLSFLAAGIGVALVCRQMGCGARARVFAFVFFAAVLLICSDYVAMDDPQLMGHAVQLFGLLLLLRRRILAAALIFSASLFLKHNLVALPLAAAAWLLWQDRNAALRFILCGAAALGAGLILFRLIYGFNLLAVLSSPRHVSLANVGLAASHLWWAVLPLAALATTRQPWKGFCLVYAGCALALGLFFPRATAWTQTRFSTLPPLARSRLVWRRSAGPFMPRFAPCPCRCSWLSIFTTIIFSLPGISRRNRRATLPFSNPAPVRLCAINCRFACGRAKAPRSMSLMWASRSRPARGMARPWQR